ncbi:unnamed protein product [Polarella glacialis]|uniref:Uncharacterized protein n=2 Tax=Polarella glacialis TaxID=89957 RepID=A0A813KV50_POLGL|nr:unnamed protein product [Polarella glacialis]
MAAITAFAIPRPVVSNVGPITRSSFHSSPQLPAFGASSSRSELALASLVAAAVTMRQASRHRTAASRAARVVRAAAVELEYGEDLAVPGDSFIVLGLAHCFEQTEGSKLQDVWVLEPVSAATVEVVDNQASTSYEAFIGTTMAKALSQDVSNFPQELLCGHKATWGDNFEFRAGCAARTWMRDHARDVVRLLVPIGEVKTGFNCCVEHKRILNFVHEVKDSDNVKQDMSIDVYGRGEEEVDVDAQIADMYNA